ncbi:MAG TPA: DUF4345 family protein [Anaerolineae bacterium]|nr:DUF4345 family protein [Anaerolineae bacterium]
MDVIEILQIVAAIATALVGLVSLAVPEKVKGFTGLDVSTARGLTEMRAILGGSFVGLGIAPLILNEPAAYAMLGIVYLATAVARVIGIVIDRSGETSNYASVAWEVLFGILLLL